MVEKPEGVMKNGVSRDTGATLGKRHRMNILIKFSETPSSIQLQSIPIDTLL